MVAMAVSGSMSSMPASSADHRPPVGSRPRGDRRWQHVGSGFSPGRVTGPGGCGARICTKRDVYPDGREFVGVGIIPDVVVDPFLTEGEDPVLERALEIVKPGK